MDEDNIFSTFVQSTIYATIFLLVSVFINYLLSLLGTCITLQKVRHNVLCEGKVLWQLPTIIGIISFIFFFGPKLYKFIIEPKLPKGYKPDKKVNLTPLVPERFLVKQLIWAILVAVIALFITVILFEI